MESPIPAGTAVQVTAPSGLHLRAKPILAGVILTTLPYGTKLVVEFDDPQSGWAQVRVMASNQEGWVTRIWIAPVPAVSHPPGQGDREYPFIQARNYNVGPTYGSPGARSIDLIVIHDAEAQEIEGQAKNIANWFKVQPAQNSVLPDGTTFVGGSSAHYACDDKEIVQCVLEKDIAWHAPGVNTRSVGIEHAGYASQSLRDWQDTYSSAMLAVSAKLSAKLCADYKIPLQFLDAEALKKGWRGITTHAQVTLAYKLGTHTDPGPNFPMLAYLDLIRGA